MDSGDLGYGAEGELYRHRPRRRNMIIKRRAQRVPQELEEPVGDVPSIRKGCVAVFGVGDPATGTERVMVVAETRETEAANALR